MTGQRLVAHAYCAVCDWATDPTPLSAHEQVGRRSDKAAERHTRESGHPTHATVYDPAAGARRR